MSLFYGTFPSLHPTLGNKYQVIEAQSYGAARLAMFNKWGSAWLFIHTPEEFRGQAKRFNLMPTGDTLQAPGESDEDS